jgi:hypothetical protein
VSVVSMLATSSGITGCRSTLARKWSSGSVGRTLTGAAGGERSPSESGVAETGLGVGPRSSRYGGSVRTGGLAQHGRCWMGVLEGKRPVVTAIG